MINQTLNRSLLPAKPLLNRPVHMIYTLVKIDLGFSKHVGL